MIRLLKTRIFSILNHSELHKLSYSTIPASLINQKHQEFYTYKKEIMRNKSGSPVFIQQTSFSHKQNYCLIGIENIVQSPLGIEIVESTQSPQNLNEHKIERLSKQKFYRIRNWLNTDYSKIHSNVLEFSKLRKQKTLTKKPEHYLSLAECYYKGSGTEQDFNKALKMYIKNY